MRGGRGPLRYVAPLLDRALPDGMRNALLQRLEAGHR
jgi:hypothetical protein